MDNEIVRVDTGTATEYIFKKMNGGGVEVLANQRGADDAFANHYTVFDAKGKTAVLRLAERTAELERLFEALKVVAITTLPGDRLVSFLERGDAETDEEEKAWETLAELLEESLAEDARKAEEARRAHR